MVIDNTDKDHTDKDHTDKDHTDKDHTDKDHTDKDHTKKYIKFPVREPAALLFKMWFSRVRDHLHRDHEYRNIKLLATYPVLFRMWFARVCGAKLFFQKTSPPKKDFEEGNEDGINAT